MRRAALLASAAALAAAALVAGASALTKPGRTRTEHAPIVALSVAGRSVTYAVADNANNTDCSHVYQWHVEGGTVGKWRFGKPTNEPCIQGTSTGDGISAVAMSLQRSLWIQYAGGNLRDWQLFTATRTSTKPKQLAFVEQDVDLPSPIVIGQGTQQGVPYAVKNAVTYLGDNGAALFKWRAPSPVRLITAGSGPGGAVVAALLESGTLDLLSSSGSVLQSYGFAPGAVTALFMGPARAIVAQVGGTVQYGKGGAMSTLYLPPGGKMVGYGAGRVFYSLKGSIHALKTSDSTDSLLVAGTRAKPAIASFATAGGFSWAIGNTVYWDCASCITFAP
jgi:hypothetical protein